MIKENDFIRQKRTSDSRPRSKIVLFAKSRKFLAIILFILVTLAITRITFIGGTFLDSFVFGLCFGYMRYVFYGWVYFNFIVKIFNLQTFSNISFFNQFLLVLIIIGSAWVYAILYRNAQEQYTFNGVWQRFGQYVREAWSNLGTKTSNNYNDLPTGLAGAFIVSIFFAIPNPYAAQSIFWIITILLFSLYAGYFFFKDYQFFINIAYFGIAIAYKYIGIKYKNFRWKIKIKNAQKALNIKKTDNSLQFDVDKWNFTAEENDKYNKFKADQEHFLQKTQEIFKDKILKNYNQYKQDHENEKDHLNTEEIKVKKENIPQDISPQNSYWTDRICKIDPNILNNFKRVNDSPYPLNINQLLTDSKTYYKPKLRREELDTFIQNKNDIINKVLLNFNIDGKVISVNVNNKIIQFEISIPSNVKINRVIELKENFKYSLAEKYLIIIAPMPGKSTIGIEIKNPNFTITSFKHLMNQAFKEKGKNYLKNKMLLGQELNGKILLQDLTNFSHLLIAGATGSGKSVQLNNIIMSIMLFNNPTNINFIMVDLKRIELNVYEKNPFLCCPIVYSKEDAIDIFNKIIEEMENRYKLFKFASVRNLEDYNKKIKDKKYHLNKIIVIIDEFADLLLYDKSNVEKLLIRICQLSRASGIHLILSTQRPSRDVITGLIKSNVPYQIALRCVSNVDSRIILDSSGAEKLLKNGDMLLRSPNYLSLKRIQSGWINSDDFYNVNEYFKSNYQLAYDFTLSEDDNEQNFLSGEDNTQQNKMEGENDDYNKIENLLINNQSINLIQIKKTTSFSNKKIFSILKKIYYANDSRFNNDELKILLIKYKQIDNEQ